MKKILLAFAVFILTSTAFADPGVIIESKGNVTIKENGKITKAITGSKFSEGATIEVNKAGKATIMFSNGSIKKLAANEKYVAVKESNPSKKGTSIIQGITMAYNDAARAGAGPTVHGMVKGAPGGQAAQLSKERKKELEGDLKKLTSLGLDRDGQSLMKAQVYYKYQQYQKSANLLLPLYNAQNPPSELVKGILSSCFLKMGKPEEASKYQ